MSAQASYLKRGRILVAGLLLAAACSAVASVSYGQTAGWSKPVRLSPQGQFGWFPSVATDLAGGVHVLWASGRLVPGSKFGSYDTIVYCQPTMDGCPQVVEVVGVETYAGAANGRPSAVVDDKGIVHMLWHGAEDRVLHSTVPVRQAASARNWSSPYQLSGSKRAYYQDVAWDQKGVLHAVWSETTTQPQTATCSSCSDIFYRRSLDGGRTWSAPKDLSNTPQWGSDKPHIALGPDGAVYVAWEEGHDFLGGGEPATSMVIASRDDGLTWEQPSIFLFPGDEPQSIAVGVDGNDKVIVVWQQLVGNGIFYQVSTDHGQSWSPPEQIPGIVTRSVNNDLDDYDMAADAAGHLHVVLVGKKAQPSETQVETYSVFHLEWDGTSWSKPIAIFTAASDVPEWPRIAVGNGNQLHVVWFVRDAANVWKSDTGEYQVWYAHGTSSAPYATPIAWPTPAPTSEPQLAEATPASTPTSTPVPTPTLDPSLALVTVPSEAIDTIYTDSDEVMLLAKSLIPAVLVIAAVIFGVRLRKRQ